MSEAHVDDVTDVDVVVQRLLDQLLGLEPRQLRHPADQQHIPGYRMRVV